MKRISLSCCVLSVAAALLAACSVLPLSLSKGQDDTQLPIATREGNAASAQRAATNCSNGWLSDAARNGQPLVYISDSDRIQIVPERPHNGRRVGRITDGISGAQGLWVDRDGSLYVANGGPGTITVYPRGCVTPSITYTGLPGPKYVVVDHAGNIFVSNSDGTVTEFLRGVTSPARTWKTPGTQADGITLDGQGNVYVTYRRTNEGYGSIEEFVPSSLSSEGHVLGMQINQPQGLVRLSSGVFLAVATGKPESIDVFPAGSQQLGKVISVPDIPTELVVTANEQHLFVVGYFAVWTTLVRRTIPTGSIAPVNILHSKIGLRKFPPGVAGMALSNGQAF